MEIALLVKRSLSIEGIEVSDSDALKAAETAVSMEQGRKQDDQGSADKDE